MIKETQFYILIFFSVLLSATNPLSAKEVAIQYQNLFLNADLNLSEGKSLHDGIIIVVHGTLAHRRMDTIKNLTEVLNERGFNTLAINLSLSINNREGMLDCNVLHQHQHLDALNEITAWLNWLKSKRVGEIYLLGHSRGGNQVAQFAMGEKSSEVKKVILLAPSTWDFLSAEKGFKNLHKRPLQPILDSAEAILKENNVNKNLTGVGILYCPNANVSAKSFVSYYRKDKRRDTPSILKKLKIPALVIAGGKDTVVEHLPSRMKAIADGHLIHFSIVDDADHFFLDLFAEDVADLIEKFIPL